MPNKPSFKGLEYAPGVVGKHQFRVRERHVAAHAAALLRSKGVGAAKLDLVLRGIALLPVHAGARQVGQVLPSVTYEQLHDLCRSPSTFTMSIPEDEDYDPVVAEKKRNWVREQLQRLEDLGLSVAWPVRAVVRC